MTDTRTIHETQTKLISQKFSPGEKNMNFVKIIFSGEHRIGGSFWIFGSDTRTIHEVRIKGNRKKTAHDA